MIYLIEFRKKTLSYLQMYLLFCVQECGADSVENLWGIN